MGELIRFPGKDARQTSTRQDGKTIKVPLEDRNRDWLTKPEDRLFHGVTIPSYADLYDISAVKVFGISPQDLLPKTGADHNDHPITELMEGQLFWGRALCIAHDLPTRDAKEHALRYLAEYTWDIAQQMQSEALKEKISQMLQDAFGVGRAGKILERMSTVSKIGKAQEEVTCEIPKLPTKKSDAAKKGFRVIK